MSDENPSPQWQALLAKARQSSQEDDSAPFGFASRVVSQLRRDAQNLRLASWRQLSLLLSGATCVVVIALQLWASPTPATDEPILPVPTLELNLATR